MILLPTRPTRTDALLPYTALFRSLAIGHCPFRRRGCSILFQKSDFGNGQGGATVSLSLADALSVPGNGLGRAHWRERLREYCDELNIVPDLISEERRVGKACGRTCGLRWSTIHYKKTRHSQ